MSRLKWIAKELKELNNLTSLDLYLSDSITDISVLKELNNLTSLNLDLSYSNITDISVLKELKELNNLTSLNLNLWYSITDISVLKDIKVKEIKLDISRTSLTSLKGMPLSVTELTVGN